MDAWLLLEIYGNASRCLQEEKAIDEEGNVLFGAFGIKYLDLNISIGHSSFNGDGADGGGSCWRQYGLEETVKAKVESRYSRETLLPCSI